MNFATQNGRHERKSYGRKRIYSKPWLKWVRLAIAKAARVYEQWKSAHTSLFNDSNVAVKLNAVKIHARLFTVGYALSHSAYTTQTSIPATQTHIGNIHMHIYIGNYSEWTNFRCSTHTLTHTYIYKYIYTYGGNGTKQHGTHWVNCDARCVCSVGVFRWKRVLCCLRVFVSTYVSTVLRYFSNYHHFDFIVVGNAYRIRSFLAHIHTPLWLLSCSAYYY